MSLATNLAQRSHLSQSTNNTAYSPLPNFLTIVGTVGQPKEKINKVALASTTLGAAAGFLGGKTGQQIQGGTSLLNNLIGGGQKQQTTTTPNETNAAPPANQTNQKQSPVNSLINGGLNSLFGKPKK
jgi:hypothetical protein